MTACDFLTGHPNQIEMVRLLLRHKANVNALSIANTTPLMIACRECVYGHKEERIGELMELLLKAGADVDAKNAFGTILHQAAAVGNPIVIRFAVSAGVDKEARDAEGRTALLVAASACRLACSRES